MISLFLHLLHIHDIAILASSTHRVVQDSSFYVTHCSILCSTDGVIYCDVDETILHLIINEILCEFFISFKKIVARIAHVSVVVEGVMDVL